MIKGLRAYHTITGADNHAWNAHDKCYGDMEGVSGCLANVNGNFSFNHGNYSNLSGDVSPLQGKVSNISGKINITGKVSKISGNISGFKKQPLTGDVSYLSGNLTGVYGCCTGIAGDLNLCNISEDERTKGVNIESLVMR